MVSANQFYSFVATSLVLLCMFPISVGAWGHSENMDSEPIIKARRDHQQSVKTGKLTWKEKTTEIKGSRLSPEESRKKKLGDQGHPPEDYTVELTKQFVFSDNRILYLTEGPRWNSKSGGLAFQKHVSVFDGNNSKIYWGPSGENYGMGCVNTENYNIDIRDFHVKPILIAYRPLHSDEGLKVSKIMSVEEGGLIATNQCLILRESRDAFGAVNLYWVDPSHDFLIRRFSQVNSKGKERLRIDFHYAEGAARGLSGWSLASLASDGALLESSSAVVSECTLNATIPDEFFSFDFPPGTRVYDKKANTEYIAREGGQRRMILLREKSVSYNELLTSETGHAFRPRSNSLVALGTLVLLALLIAIWCLRKGPIWKKG